MRLVKFRPSHLPLFKPRPPSYMAEMRACAQRATNSWWVFDEDSPCYQQLKERYADAAYVPTPGDWARWEQAKAEYKAKRDEYTASLWAALHRFTLTPAAHDPDKFLAFLNRFRAKIPCGQCTAGWDAILAQSPPDANDPVAWAVAAHNAVNAKLGKRQWTKDEAVAAWA